MKVRVIPIEIGELARVKNGLVKVLEELEIRTQVDTIQTTAVKIGLNTGKNPGGPRRLAVTQTPAVTDGGAQNSERSKYNDNDNNLNNKLNKLI